MKADPATRAPTPAAVRTTAREAIPVHRVPQAPTRLSPGAGAAAVQAPLHQSSDHRFARPDPFVVVHPAHAYPRYVWYRPCWTHWYVHPWWRWTHATTVVVWFDYTPDPWVDAWVPPPRTGWVWVPGWWSGPSWIPGYWGPVGPEPAWYGVSWAWVPGWWMGTVWVEGYWRRTERPGWSWADGYYLDDGAYVRGWWEPAGAPPIEGYLWEGGYWDGTFWVEGFWRPEQREGYRWVSAWLDEAGVYHSGYWEPLEARPEMVWIPGWFDGEEWIEGYWVPEQEYEAEDPEHWEPEPGWDARPVEGGSAPPQYEELPPALPVQGPAEGGR